MWFVLDFLGQEKEDKAKLCPSPKDDGLILFPVLDKQNNLLNFFNL